MLVSWRSIASLLSIACCFTLIGCGGGGTTPKAGGSSKTGSASSGGDQKARDHSPGTALSAEDQKLADLQKVCPVSDEPLGGMGPPVKLVVKGQPIFICCKGCAEEIDADPDKYIAKVAQLVKANPE